MNTSENNYWESLTLQQRNLLLAEPIVRLAIEKRTLFRDDPVLDEHLDVRYLALSALDFVMERSAIESGAVQDDIVGHVANESKRMNIKIPNNLARKVGQVVLDYLTNARDGHKAFRLEYYDPARNTFTFSDFRLLSLFIASDESIRFKLDVGAQTLTLAMLDISPEFSEEAETIMINKAVERGRFDDARTLAQRARMRSIYYQQFIDDRLFQMRRASDRIVWSEEVLPELDNAREHLKKRQKHENEIIASIREHISSKTGDTRKHLIELKDVLVECHQRNTALIQRVMSASEEFRRFQVSAFQARLMQDIPDLEEDILVPLLSTPLNTLRGISDDIHILFSAPTAPCLYDLASLFRKVAETSDHCDFSVDDDFDDLVEIFRVPPEFDEDEIHIAEEWLVQRMESGMQLDMRSAVRIAEEQGLSESTIRCILFLMVRSWCPNDDKLGVIATVDGDISHPRVAGDNIVLTRNAQQ